MKNDTIESLLLELIQGFTRFRGDIVMDAVESPRALNISVTAHADDTSKLIGAGGAMVKALRVVGERIGATFQTIVRVNVLEPQKGKKLFQDPYKFNPAFKLDGMMDLLKRIGQVVYNETVEVEQRDTDRESSILLLKHDVDDYDEELEDALSTIFHAISKANGRKVYVELDTL